MKTGKQLHSARIIPPRDQIEVIRKSIDRLLLTANIKGNKYSLQRAREAQDDICVSLYEVFDIEQ